LLLFTRLSWSFWLVWFIGRFWCRLVGILEEVWRIKDELSREFAADPDAYFAKLDEIAEAEEKAGRKVIRSAEELRQLVVETERQRAEESAFVLNDKPVT
jgi:hypothetical protein